jgi:hypothetical protein
VLQKRLRVNENQTIVPNTPVRGAPAH